MSAWLIIAAVSLITFGLRASFIVFADPHRFPHIFRQSLSFVPPAVFAAIVLPGLAMPNGVLDLTLSNPRWVAGLLALAVAARTRHPMAAIATGLPTLWLLQWVLH
ncbi:MAG TPA: AzlD domain-containing protein [Usitatibacter sp.]|nr:AzlD domain-containing protein [Usitatibacter sp.]